MSGFLEGLMGRGDQWRPDVTNPGQTDIELFATSMRDNAVALLRDHGQLERMHKLRVVNNALANIAVAAPIEKQYAPIGDHTFVAAPVEVFGVQQVVAVGTWTFRPPEKAEEISMYREDTNDYLLLLKKGRAHVNGGQTRSGLRLPTFQDRSDWALALNALAETAEKHPELLLPTSPIVTPWGVLNR